VLFKWDFSAFNGTWPPRSTCQPKSALHKTQNRRAQKVKVFAPLCIGTGTHRNSGLRSFPSGADGHSLREGGARCDGVMCRRGARSGASRRAGRFVACPSGSGLFWRGDRKCLAAGAASPAWGRRWRRNPEAGTVSVRSVERAPRRFWCGAADVTPERPNPRGRAVAGRANGPSPVGGFRREDGECRAAVAPSPAWGFSGGGGTPELETSA